MLIYIHNKCIRQKICQGWHVDLLLIVQHFKNIICYQQSWEWSVKSMFYLSMGHARSVVCKSNPRWLQRSRCHHLSINWSRLRLLLKPKWHFTHLSCFSHRIRSQDTWILSSHITAYIWSSPCRWWIVCHSVGVLVCYIQNEVLAVYWLFTGYNRPSSNVPLCVCDRACVSAVVPPRWRHSLVNNLSDNQKRTPPLQRCLVVAVPVLMVERAGQETPALLHRSSPHLAAAALCVFYRWRCSSAGTDAAAVLPALLPRQSRCNNAGSTPACTRRRILNEIFRRAGQTNVWIRALGRNRPGEKRDGGRGPSAPRRHRLWQEAIPRARVGQDQCQQKQGDVSARCLHRDT